MYTTQGLLVRYKVLAPAIHKDLITYRERNSSYICRHFDMNSNLCWSTESQTPKQRERYSFMLPMRRCNTSDTPHAIEGALSQMSECQLKCCAAHSYLTNFWGVHNFIIELPCPRAMHSQIPHPLALEMRQLVAFCLLQCQEGGSPLPSS